MLSLDDDDYEALGWGGEREYERMAAVAKRAETVADSWVAQLSARYTPNIEAKRARDKRYRQTDKGREATARRDERRASGTYFADYYAANREKIKERVKKWQQGMSDEQRAKRAEYDKQRYERKKAERERLREEQVR